MKKHAVKATHHHQHQHTVKGAKKAHKPPKVHHQHLSKQQHAAAHRAALRAAHTRARHAANKKRGFALGDGVACCAAQALGTLYGWTEDEILALYWRTASDPDSGASILDTLAAVNQRWGRPAGSAPSDTGAGLILGVELPGPHAVAVTPDGTWWSWGEPFDPADWPLMTIEEAWEVPWL